MAGKQMRCWHGQEAVRLRGEARLSCTSCRQPSAHARRLQPPHSGAQALLLLTAPERGVHLLQLVLLARDEHVDAPLGVLQLRKQRRVGHQQVPPVRQPQVGGPPLAPRAALLGRDCLGRAHSCRRRRLDG